MTSQERLSGAHFLFKDVDAEQAFTPEDFSAEQRQVIAMIRKFADQSVAPVIDRIEGKDFGILRGLMKEAGELGLFAIDIPEESGGLEMGSVTSSLVAEWISVSASFTVTFMAHSGIGTLPLLWYGTPQQRRTYLPGIITGQTIAAYALSEASSGSDALNIRTSATLSEDGKHYVLNGEKMWISNAGLADLFTLFAKIDGKHFTAFLVERDTPGLSIGKEETKMGIRGSSTCAVALRDCKVPIHNVLGTTGKGHYIAFNVLNAGRYKLGAMALGAARYALADATAYSKQRSAFGKPIAEFGLIQEKLAESATLLYIAEALVYRTVGAIEESLSQLNSADIDHADQVQNRIAQFSVGCSIVKVWCSEMQATIVDHVLQIYAGYGFTEDYPASRHYRDARINRIFEGTNEINRLIISSGTAKSAMDGMADAVANAAPDAKAPFGDLRLLVWEMKMLTRLGLSRVCQKYGERFTEVQELAGALSDMIAEVYALESGLLRLNKSGLPEHADLVSYYANISRRRFIGSAEKVFGHMDAVFNVRGTPELYTRLGRVDADPVMTGRRIASHMLRS